MVKHPRAPLCVPGEEREEGPVCPGLGADPSAFPPRDLRAAPHDDFPWVKLPPARAALGEQLQRPDPEPAEVFAFSVFPPRPLFNCVRVKKRLAEGCSLPNGGRR